MQPPLGIQPIAVGGPPLPQKGHLLYSYLPMESAGAQEVGVPPEGSLLYLLNATVTEVSGPPRKLSGGICSILLIISSKFIGSKALDHAHPSPREVPSGRGRSQAEAHCTDGNRV